MPLRRHPIASRVCATFALFATTGCIGLIGEPVGLTGTGDGAVPSRLPDGAIAPPPPPPIAPGESGFAETALRRLSVNEYVATLRDLIGETNAPVAMYLPADATAPFDNDHDRLDVSSAFLEGLRGLTDVVVDRLLADMPRRDRVVGCRPTGPGDAACFRTFVTTFGRRAFRRPLSDAEVTGLLRMQQFGVEDNNFYTGVRGALRAMLLDPEFVYHVEVGTPVAGQPGVAQLTSWEMASRLSYFLWGTMPDDALFAAAAAGQLETPEQLRAQAERMFDDPRARAAVDRFHALWLGYDELPHAAALSAAMRRETRALIERVVFERRASWLELFRSTETFIDATLAAHYELPAPAGTAPAWVPYGTSGRRGILSHGSFLSAPPLNTSSGTSPVLRGLGIRDRLLCLPELHPPPEANAAVANLPPDYNRMCYEQQLTVSARSEGGCGGCHRMFEPIGVGLQGFSQTGRARASYRPLDDPMAPVCGVRAEGEVLGVGRFSGPAELGDLLIASGRLEQCVATQLYRFALGRHEEADEANYLRDLGARFRDSGHRFDRLLVEVVTSRAFRFRREP